MSIYISRICSERIAPPKQPRLRAQYKLYVCTQSLTFYNTGPKSKKSMTKPDRDLVPSGYRGSASLKHVPSAEPRQSYCSPLNDATEPETVPDYDETSSDVC